MSELIELCDVCKSYDKGKSFVLQHLNFAMEKGSIATIQGRSGSGKSTLLNLLGLLDKLDTGRYIFEGKEVKAGGRQARLLRREIIGFIFQNYALIENCSIQDNILIAGQYSGTDFGIIRHRMSSLLEKLSLQELADKKSVYLSGGEKQRAAIARALVKEPELVLADEPTGNLDETNALIINQVLKEYASEGHTVLIVTHNPHIFNNVHRRFKLEGGELKEI